MIGIDLDGVLTLFNESFNTVVNSLYPEKKVPYDYQQKQWDWEELLTQDQLNKVWEVINNNPSFWRRMKPDIPAVVAVESFLLNNTKDLYFITSRKNTGGVSAIAQTNQWLKEYSIGQYIHTSLIRVAHAHQKARIIRGLELTHMLDDYGPTVEACQKITGHQCYVLDRPYNRVYDVPRVSSVQEFLDIVKADL